MTQVIRSLADIRALLIDMDGVIYHDEATLPGVARFLDYLRAHGIRFAFATNGTRQWPRDHRDKLARYGIDAHDVAIHTAGLATAHFVKGLGTGLRVYCIGGPGLKDQLVQLAGCRLEEEHPEAVVVGWTEDFDYRQLEIACLAVHRGARLILADPDNNDPSPLGPLPGSGAYAAAITAATGVEPLSIGKPSPILFESALAAIGATPNESAMLGDRLDSDVRGGLAMGMGTILILTGYTTPAMVERSTIKPHWVVQDLTDLMGRWEAALAE